MKATISTSPGRAESENDPSIAEVVPVVPPLMVIVAPITGPLASVTVPLTVTGSPPLGAAESEMYLFSSR